MAEPADNLDVFWGRHQLGYITGPSREASTCQHTHEVASGVWRGGYVVGVCWRNVDPKGAGDSPVFA